MSTFIFTAKLFAQPGKRDELFENFKVISSFMENNVPGCQKYEVRKAPDDLNVLEIKEEWDTKESHDQSLSIPEVQGFIKENMPLLDLTKK
jgi:quinol monooxygenase YgiN